MKKILSILAVAGLGVILYNEYQKAKYAKKPRLIK
jgi:hypothetical protein